MRALWNVRHADALVSFGGPGPGTALTIEARERRVPVIVIWAGTDYLLAAGNPFDLEVTKREVSLDLAGAPWLAEELRGIGVAAQYEPIIGVNPASKLAPLPKRFTVLTYLPEARRAFYGEERVYTIARALPEARFVVVGPGAANLDAPANVEFFGFVRDMARVIDGSTVLLRLPEHDGPAMMVLESLSRGRHAIWTHDFPGVFCANDTEKALRLVRDLYERHCAGNLKLNTTGWSFVAQNFHRSGIAQRFESRLDAIAPQREPEERKRKRIAVTGLSLFCAEVADRIEDARPEWEVQLLRPSSRLDVIASLAQLRRADVWYSIGAPFTSRWMDHCARFLRIPRVMHWVGSDIESIRDNPKMRSAVSATAAKHLAEVDFTARELSALGIPSRIVPLPLRHYASGVRPLPERFTILLYIPTSRPEFYGLRKYERLLDELAHEDLSVIVVGGGALRAPASVSLENWGWCLDLRKAYESSTVLIRVTPHDGLSLMVMEALSFGRHVIWSKPFPYASRASTYEQLVSSTRDLLERHKAGRLFSQYAAAEMIHERYGTERCVEEILITLDEAREERASRGCARCS